MAELGFLGGTGDLGRGLALHLSRSYDKTLIGSREKSKAAEAVAQLQAHSAGREYLKDRLVPATNQEVAERCDVVIATLPAKHAVSGVKELAGHFRGDQLIVSTVAPTPKVGEEYLPAFEGDQGISKQSSITQQMKNATVLSSLRFATAFQTVPAKGLMREERIEADVPITCDEDLYEQAAEVVKHVEGLRPLYLGSLDLSGVAEAMTSILLNIGKHNSMHDPIIKFYPGPSGTKK